jgi:hypothetical protein
MANKKIRIQLIEDGKVINTQEHEVEFTPFLQLFYAVGEYIVNEEEENKRKPWPTR